MEIIVKQHALNDLMDYAGLCSIDGKCSNLNENCLNNMYYGPFCDISCSEISDKCQACDRNGNCLKCKNKLFFGNKCENSCQNCPEGICEMDGVCTNSGNCKVNEYFGDKCSILVQKLVLIV